MREPGGASVRLSVSARSRDKSAARGVPVVGAETFMSINKGKGCGGVQMGVKFFCIRHSGFGLTADGGEHASEKGPELHAVIRIPTYTMQHLKP